MTPEQKTELCRLIGGANACSPGALSVAKERILTFVESPVAGERESCAVLCDEYAAAVLTTQDMAPGAYVKNILKLAAVMPAECAAAIREAKL